MQRGLVLTLLLQSSIGAFGTNCGAGRKALADLTGLTCSLSGSDAKSCDSNCCVDNELTCGGAEGGVKCPFDSYIASGDAWKAKATTKDTKTTDCCTKKAKCGAAPTCPAGWKTKTDAADVMCSTDAKSCTEVDVTNKIGTCCVLNHDTCGGIGLAEKNANGDTLKVDCSGKANTHPGSDDAWKKTAVPAATPKKTTQAEFDGACCASNPTCASTAYSCKDGFIRDDTKVKDADDCGGDISKCAATCCTANGCGSHETLGDIACEVATGGYYPKNDAWFKNLKASNANKGKLVTDRTNPGCCTPKATCLSAVCPAGSKKKKNVDKEECDSDAASCNVPVGTCCESDTTKCGGLLGITCPYGYYDESIFFVKTGDKAKQTPKAVIDAWMNKPATDATKNTACCTAKAACSGGAIVTTTPAATATPATPVRRYSAHKLTQETSSSSANMVWLCVGGFIGMASLMAVQGLRSRMQAATQERDTYSNVE